MEVKVKSKVVPLLNAEFPKGYNTDVPSIDRPGVRDWAGATLGPQRHQEYTMERNARHHAHNDAIKEYNEGKARGSAAAERQGWVGYLNPLTPNPPTSSWRGKHECEQGEDNYILCPHDAFPCRFKNKCISKAAPYDSQPPKGGKSRKKKTKKRKRTKTKQTKRRK